MPEPTLPSNDNAPIPAFDLQDIFDRAPIGIFTSTPEGRCTSVNPALARTYGYDSPEELIESVTDIATQVYVDAEDRKKFIRLLEKHGEVFNHECRIRCRDGSDLWVSRNARTVRNSEGCIVACQGFTADITDRKLTEDRERERFVESSLLFGLDQLIKAILRAFNRTFLTVAAFLPIPGTGGLVKLINTIVNLSLTYLDEVILAYLMKTRAENPWASSRTALVLYAQNYVAFLKNAVWLALFIWAMTFAVFLVVLGPAALIVGFFPGTGGPLTLIVALVLAWGIKQAIIEPIGMTALMQVFFKVTEGQVANPEWEAKLEGVSSKFRELADKAKGWSRENATAQTSDA